MTGDHRVGDLVQILLQGTWAGPFTVTGRQGRTPDHLVLLNPANGTLFEHYADDYNTKADS